MSRLALVCALVGIHGMAGAQPRYPRPQSVPAIAAPSPQVRPPSAPAAKPRPTLSAEAVLSLGGLVAKPRSEQEQIFVALVQDTPDTDAEEKSDLLFRLAELYSAQSFTFRAKGDAQRAKDALIKAVKTWKALVDNERFRNYPRLDAALFEYGYTLQTGKYLKEARAAYDQLLKNYPQSKYVPEAHLAFAEYYVEAGQLADAEARYKIVLKFPKAPGYAYAMYRLGWIHYDLQRFQEALEGFYNVVALTKDDKPQMAVNAAAKQGFVEAYAQIGKPDKAAAAFARVDPAASLEMLQQLAARSIDSGKPDHTVFLYQELIKAAPTHRNVCRWQANVATAMQAFPAASVADKTREIENLVKLHLALEKAKTLPAQEAQECRDRAAAMSGDLARSLQVQSMASKDDTNFVYAERAYKAHAEGFPDAAAPSSFADLLWSRAEAERNARLQPERWAAAADAYLDLARTSTDPRKVREAATISVLAWKNGLAVDPRPVVQAGVIDLEAAASAKPAAIVVPPTEAKLAAAFAVYERSITDRDELARTKFLRATLHRRHGDHAQAVGALTELLAKFREHETAELAANLLMDSLIRMQRFDDVLAAVDQFAADAKFLEGKPALQANIKLLRSRSLRRR
jgi:tetratricopeptide (TPR) repeat protein